MVLMSAVNVLKFQNTYAILFFPKFFMHLFQKIPDRKANRVDPDQTAPEGAVWSGSALFAYAILSDKLVFEILAHFAVSTNMFLWGNKKNIHVHVFWLIKVAYLALCVLCYSLIQYTIYGQSSQEVHLNMCKMPRFRSSYTCSVYYLGLCFPVIHSVVSNDSDTEDHSRPWSGALLCAYAVRHIFCRGMPI